MIAMLCFFVAGASLPAAAQSPTSAATPPMPDVLQTLVEEGAQARYLGQRFGMDGWVIIKGGQEQYFYVTPDKRGLVSGILFDTDGRAVTVEQVRRLRGQDPETLDALTGNDAQSSKLSQAQTSKTPQEQLFADIAASNWFVMGQPQAPVAYAIIDPQCPHCHDLITELETRGVFEDGRLQLRVIPVGVVDLDGEQNSLYRAAYLLAAPNPQDRLRRFINGELEALPVKRDLNTQGVQRNMTIMKNWSLDATPFLLYKGRQGDVRLIRGNVRDMDAFLREAGR